MMDKPPGKQPLLTSINFIPKTSGPVASNYGMSYVFQAPVVIRECKGKSRRFEPCEVILEIFST